MSETQKPMLDPVVAALHREIYQLRQSLERAERAAGRVAADKSRTWDDVAAALGVATRLPDAPLLCLRAIEGLQAAAHKRSDYADAEIAKIRAAKTPGELAKVGDVVRCTIDGHLTKALLLEWNDTQGWFESDDGNRRRPVSRARIHDIVTPAP